MSTDYKPVHTPVYTQADLDQARKEARAAAFREITAIEYDYRAMTRPDFYVKHKVQTLALAIEAAANTEGGGGDG